MAQPKLEANGKTWGITANYTDARGVYRRKYQGGFPHTGESKKVGYRLRHGNVEKGYHRQEHHHSASN